MVQFNVDVIGTGFTVLDRIYENGANATSHESLGGSCGNVLISLAMLSRKVVPVIALGQDEVGTRLLMEFKQAGADTSHINCYANLRSPILAQKLDTKVGQHSFSFVCPETNTTYPKYIPIQKKDVQKAGKVLDTCHVFYTDRLSDTILSAMQKVHRSGAITYFEPSKIDDDNLFEKALKYTSILKYSSDRLVSAPTVSDLPNKAVLIITHGADGLEIRKAGETPSRLESVKARIVRDTCGSGDMVSVGIIDGLIKLGQRSWSTDAIEKGIRAGQRLAAANCSFSGARGLFSTLGAEVARYILNNEEVDIIHQMDLFDTVKH